MFDIHIPGIIRPYKLFFIKDSLQLILKDRYIGKFEDHSLEIDDGNIWFCYSWGFSEPIIHYTLKGASSNVGLNLMTSVKIFDN